MKKYLCLVYSMCIFADKIWSIMISFQSVICNQIFLVIFSFYNFYGNPNHNWYNHTLNVIITLTLTVIIIIPVTLS